MTLSSERNTQQMQLWGRLMAALPFSLWPRAATKPSVWWTSSMLTSQGESECLPLSLWLFPFLFIYVISSRFLFDRLFIYGLLFYCFQRAALLVKWIIIVVFFGGIIRTVKNLLKMPHIYGHFDHVRTDLKATWEEVKRKSVPTNVQLIDSTKNLQK